MGHDIGDRLAVDRERDAFTGSDRIDDSRRPIAKVSNPYLHVLQRSISPVKKKPR